MPKKPDQYLVEDIGAIAFELGNHSKARQFYDKLGPILSGFTGIWGFSGHAGQIFHEEVEKLGDNVWDNYQWIDSVFTTVNNIIEAALADPDSVPDGNFDEEQAEWLRKHVEILPV